jgi:hypothetical protein
MESKTTKTIELFKNSWESKEKAYDRIKKQYNISKEDLDSGKVKIRVLDADEVFNSWKKYGIKK